MTKTLCQRCSKRDICINPDICPKVGPQLYRIEHGDKRYKKNQHRIKLRFESDMDRIEYIVFQNKTYGAFDGE